MNNIVLFEPEIPQNTGNIMRTALATNFKVHLIEPLGFKLDDVSLKRSGANHIKHVDYFVYSSWDDFVYKNKGEFYFYTRYGLKTYTEVDLSDTSKNYYYIFGKESTGIDKEILKTNLDRCLRLPMNEHMRSLNLSNTVAIICYDALRQQGFPGLSIYEPEIQKGKDFLLKK